MTVPATTRRAGPFTGNGGTTSFPFTFKTFSTEDLAVTLTDADALESTLVLDSDYSVTLNGDQDATPGGSITYPLSGAPLAIGEKLTVVGAVDYDQTADLPTGGSFSPIVIENALDRATLQIQQLAEQAGRALTVAPAYGAIDNVLPAPEASKGIGWNETGTALVNYSASDFATVVVNGTSYTDVFSGTGAQTTFALTANPGSVNALDIAISGVSQVNGVDFTVSGSTLTFTSAPAAATGNICVRYVAALPVASAHAQDVIYDPVGTGAVSTTVEVKLRETVSVQDFGADPTGAVGASTSIQLALNSGARRIVATGVFLVDADLVLPNGVIFDCTDATFLASANGRTLLKSGASSYASRIVGGLWKGNGKTGVVAMDLSNFRLPSEVLNPRIEGTAVGIILRTGCFGSALRLVTTINCPAPVQVLANASTLLIDCPNLDNTVTFGGSGAGIGIDVRAGGGDNIGVVIRGGYVQGFATGLLDAGIKTVVDATYFELCTAADVEGAAARGSMYRATQHFATVGATGFKLRTCESVTIFDPVMANGARTVLYDVDATNSDCYEYRPRSASLFNSPTGPLTYLGRTALQDTGTFTPVVVGSGTPGVGTYSVQSGKWSRTGDLVHYDATVTWSAHTGTGNVQITGLPVALAPASFTPTRTFIATTSGLAFTGPVLYASFSGVSTTLNLLQLSTAGVVSLVPIGGSGTINVTGSFEL